MAIEIIDLTDSPPSPPRSNSSSSSNNNNAPMILNFGAVSAQYPNMHHIHHHHHQTNYALWPNYVSPGVHSTYYHPSHIATTTTRFVQPSSSMLGDQVTTTVLAPSVPQSNAFLFPHGTRLRDPWTQREHELFLMGLIKFGKGRWTKIAGHFLWNKTPQQVQSYAASFFRHLPATYLHGFRRRKTNNNNNSAVFQASPPYGSMTTYGSQMETVGSASTSRASMMSTTTAASADGGEELDLELRLG